MYKIINIPLSLLFLTNAYISHYSVIISLIIISADTKTKTNEDYRKQYSNTNVSKLIFVLEVGHQMMKCQEKNLTLMVW